MKTQIDITFKKIMGKEVNKELLKDNPLLMGATRKTIYILCEQIEKYFKEKKIIVKTTFELHNEN